jgi:proliferating cell nuclear antigen
MNLDLDRLLEIAELFLGIDNTTDTTEDYQEEAVEESRKEKEDEEFKKVSARFGHSDAYLVKTLLEAINTVSDEPRVNVTPDGLFLREMDPAHVSLIDVRMKHLDFFEYYEVEKEGEVVLPLERLLKVFLQGSMKGYRMDAEIKDGMLSMEVSKYNTPSKKFSIELLSPQNKVRLPELKLSFDAYVTMSVKSLYDAITQLRQHATEIMLTTIPGKFMIASKTDVDQASVSFDYNSFYSLDIRGDKEEVKAIYSIDYLYKFLRPITKLRNTTIAIEYSHNKPLRLTITTLENPYLEIYYYLAPKVT